VSSAWELLKKDQQFGVGGITVDKVNMRDVMTETNLGYSIQLINQFFHYTRMQA
jgi:hypothetical protein